MLRLEHTCKRWGAFAHKDISLTVAAGEFFVLLGPSGAGKSLLLDLIAGFHRPDSGRIFINDADVTRLPPEKRNVGFVFQDQMLFPHKSARQNIAYGLTVRRTPKKVAAERIERLAAALHIEACLDRRVGAISVGQKQRVALARALAVEPDLLLLDEPFSSLDPPLKERLWAELKALHKRTGVTALHVTHDRGEALALGQSVGVISDGRIAQTGSDASVFERPDSAFVAEFTGARNIYSGEASVRESLTVFSSGPLELVSTTRLSGPCYAVVRPENIIVSRRPARTSARNQIRGEVESLARRADLCQVTGRFAESLMTCVVTPLSVEELRLEPGATVYFTFKAGSVHLFLDGTAAVDD